MYANIRVQIVFSLCTEGFLIDMQDPRPYPIGQGHCLKSIYMYIYNLKKKT